MYNKKLSVNSIKFSDLISPLKGGTAMKKHIKEITALLICAAMLTACGNNGGTPASAPAESTSAQPAASPISETGESVTKAETTLSETGSELPEENGYRIFVRNEKGDPVNGVLLQFCSDSECVLGETDTDGTAVFDYPDGSYTVHILKAPAGYADDENEYPAPASRGTVEIMLKTDTPDKETEWQNIDELDFTKPVNIMLPEYGITYKEPDKFFGLKGYMDPGASSLSDTDPIFREFCFYYTPFSRYDMDNIIAYYDAVLEAKRYKEEEPQPPDERWKDWLDLFFIISGVYITDADLTAEEVSRFIEKSDSGTGEIAEIEKISADIKCSVWYVRFGGIEERAEEIKDQLGEYYDELIDVYNDKETQLSGLTFSDPVDFAEEEEKTVSVGDTFSFEATDLDGNKVSSTDLFSGHRITMINVWATWCGPCKRELPMLGELAKEFKEKGGQIVGFCLDADNDKHIGKAKEILTENGCSYINICPFDGSDDVFPTYSYPTTYFVDSEGRLLAEPIYGNDVEAYPAVFNECLEAME